MVDDLVAGVFGGRRGRRAHFVALTGLNSLCAAYSIRWCTMMCACVRSISLCLWWTMGSFRWISTVVRGYCSFRHSTNAMHSGVEHNGWVVRFQLFSPGNLWLSSQPARFWHWKYDGWHGFLDFDVAIFIWCFWIGLLDMTDTHCIYLCVCVVRVCG